GTIINDDAAAASTFSIAATSASKTEGASGATTPFTFTVTRAGSTAGSASVAWVVAGSGASPVAGSDFTGGVLPSGTVSFAAGEVSKTITVNVAGDSTVEANEGFAVTLSNPTGATITTASATGTIINDDDSGSTGGTPIVGFSLQNTAGAASQAQYVQ